MTDNFDRTCETVESTATQEYFDWEHADHVLLRERLAPLLKDAIDALEIDPPAPGVSLRRIQTALLVALNASRIG